MDRATARQLSDLERTFVQRLIEADPSSRLTRGYEVRTTLKEIIGNLEAASSNAFLLMRRAVELMAARRHELADCPAQHALKLAIWSDF